MAFFVHLIHRLSVKVKLLAEGFWRMAWERVSKVGVAQNRDIWASVGMESHPAGTVWGSPGTSSPCPQHPSPLAHPGLQCRVGIPRGSDLLSLLWQQAGNRKRNNVWKSYFPTSRSSWLLEELPWILLVLHALLTNVAAFVLHSPQLPGTLPHRKTPPPAETRDKPRCGSNPTANGDRGKLYWTGTNL